MSGNVSEHRARGNALLDRMRALRADVQSVLVTEGAGPSHGFLPPRAPAPATASASAGRYPPPSHHRHAAGKDEEDVFFDRPNYQVVAAGPRASSAGRADSAARDASMISSRTLSAYRSASASTVPSGRPSIDNWSFGVDPLSSTVAPDATAPRRTAAQTSSSSPPSGARSSNPLLSAFRAAAGGSTPKTTAARVTASSATPKSGHGQNDSHHSLQPPSSSGSERFRVPVHRHVSGIPEVMSIVTSPTGRSAPQPFTFPAAGHHHSASESGNSSPRPAKPSPRGGGGGLESGALADAASEASSSPRGSSPPFAHGSPQQEKGKRAAPKPAHSTLSTLDVAGVGSGGGGNVPLLSLKSFGSLLHSARNSFLNSSVSSTIISRHTGMPVTLISPPWTEQPDDDGSQGLSRRKSVTVAMECQTDEAPVAPSGSADHNTSAHTIQSVAVASAPPPPLITVSAASSGHHEDPHASPGKGLVKHPHNASSSSLHESETSASRHHRHRHRHRTHHRPAAVTATGGRRTKGHGNGSSTQTDDYRTDSDSRGGEVLRGEQHHHHNHRSASEEVASARAVAAPQPVPMPHPLSQIVLLSNTSAPTTATAAGGGSTTVVSNPNAPLAATYAQVIASIAEQRRASAAPTTGPSATGDSPRPHAEAPKPSPKGSAVHMSTAPRTNMRDPSSSSPTEGKASTSHHHSPTTSEAAIAARPPANVVRQPSPPPAQGPHRVRSVEYLSIADMSSSSPDRQELLEAIGSVQPAKVTGHGGRVNNQDVTASREVSASRSSDAYFSAARPQAKPRSVDDGMNKKDDTSQATSALPPQQRHTSEIVTGGPVVAAAQSVPSKGTAAPRQLDSGVNESPYQGPSSLSRDIDVANTSASPHSVRRAVLAALNASDGSETASVTANAQRGRTPVEEDSSLNPSTIPRRRGLDPATLRWHAPEAANTATNTSTSEKDQSILSVGHISPGAILLSSRVGLSEPFSVMDHVVSANSAASANTLAFLASHSPPPPTSTATRVFIASPSKKKNHRSSSHSDHQDHVIIVEKLEGLAAQGSDGGFWRAIEGSGAFANHRKPDHAVERTVSGGAGASGGVSPRPSQSPRRRSLSSQSTSPLRVHGLLDDTRVPVPKRAFSIGYPETAPSTPSPARSRARSSTPSPSNAASDDDGSDDNMRRAMRAVQSHALANVLEALSAKKESNTTRTPSTTPAATDKGGSVSRRGVSVAVQCSTIPNCTFDAALVAELPKKKKAAQRRVPGMPVPRVSRSEPGIHRKTDAMEPARSRSAELRLSAHRQRAGNPFPAMGRPPLTLSDAHKAAAARRAAKDAACTRCSVPLHKKVVQDGTDSSEDGHLVCLRCREHERRLRENDVPAHLRGSFVVRDALCPPEVLPSAFPDPRPRPSQSGVSAFPDDCSSSDQPRRAEGTAGLSTRSSSTHSQHQPGRRLSLVELSEGLGDDDLAPYDFAGDTYGELDRGTNPHYARSTYASAVRDHEGVTEDVRAAGSGGGSRMAAEIWGNAEVVDSHRHAGTYHYHHTTSRHGGADRTRSQLSASKSRSRSGHRPRSLSEQSDLAKQRTLEALRSIRQERFRALHPKEVAARKLFEERDARLAAFLRDRALRAASEEYS